MDFSKFQNKYIIEGTLSVYSLHVGKYRTEENFDSPTIKYLNNIAYIPGSNFRDRFQYKLKTLVNLGLNLEDRKLHVLDIKEIFGNINTRKNSNHMGGKIYIEDLVIEPNKKNSIYSDVTINRHTGIARKSNKFDYNTIENATFKLNIILENLQDYEVDLINIGLNLMKDDMFGQRTTGQIGRCKLNIDRVKYITKENLNDYLFHGKMKVGTQEILNKGKVTLNMEK